MIIIMMVVVVVLVRLIVSADVDHQTGRIVSHHVEELSLQLELVDLVLSVPPRQQWDDSVHFPHPSHNISSSSWVLLQWKLVCLKKRRNLQTLSAVYAWEIRTVTKGLCYSQRYQRFIEIQNRLRCEGRNFQFQLMRDEWFEQFIPGPLVQFSLQFIQATCKYIRLVKSLHFIRPYRFIWRNIIIYNGSII